MIPLRETTRLRRPAVLTYAVIGLNALVWLYQVALEPSAALAFVQRWGAVPHYLVVDPHLGSYVTPISSLFVHAGWLHVIGNMWFLHVFGGRVEEALGPARYAGLYLLSGVAAVVLHVVIEPDAQSPLVGASGAIAGVLAAYVRLHPRGRVLTLVPILIFVQLAELPALVFVLLWFAYQLAMALLSLGGAESGGVAFFAHIGGFLAGLALVSALRPRRR